MCCFSWVVIFSPRVFSKQVLVACLKNISSLRWCIYLFFPFVYLENIEQMHFLLVCQRNWGKLHNFLKDKCRKEKLKYTSKQNLLGVYSRKTQWPSLVRIQSQLPESQVWTFFFLLKSDTESRNSNFS